MTLPPCGVDSETWSSSSVSMPDMSGEAIACRMRFWTAPTSDSLIAWAAATAPGESATATRGLGLPDGVIDAERTGVGMGVLMLRVSVAAAPGTGVASGPSRTEQEVVSADRSAATRSAGLAQVIAQLLGSAWMPQLAKRLGLDLPDPFSSNPELTTDFLQRTLASVVQPKPQGNDAAFSL